MGDFDDRGRNIMEQHEGVKEASLEHLEDCQLLKMLCLK